MAASGPDSGPVTEHAEHSPWRDGRFRIFATGNVINNIGEAVYTVALPLFVFERTGSLAVMSLLAALTPATLLLGPFLGYLVDRYGSRILVVPGLLVQAVAAVAMNLTALADDAPTWPLFVFGALVQIGGAGYRTGWMTGVAHMFPDNPVRSRGSLSSLYVITNVVGPLLVSAALLWVGYAALLWMNVLTFLAPIVVWLIGIHPPRRTSAPAGGGVLTGMADGWRTVRERPVILHAVLVYVPMLIAGTTGGLTLSLFRLQDEWKLSPETVGIILVAVRIAGVLGTVLVSERKTFPFRKIVLVGTVGMGLALTLMAAGSLWVFVVAMVLMFGFQHALGVAADLMPFKFLPPGALGRGAAIVNLMMGMPVLAGPLLIPLVARGIGPGATFLVLGLLQLAGLLWLRHTWHAWSPAAGPEPEPAPRPEPVPAEAAGPDTAERIEEQA